MAISLFLLFGFFAGYFVWFAKNTTQANSNSDFDAAALKTLTDQSA